MCREPVVTRASCVSDGVLNGATSPMHRMHTKGPAWGPGAVFTRIGGDLEGMGVADFHSMGDLDVEIGLDSWVF